MPCNDAETAAVHTGPALTQQQLGLGAGPSSAAGQWLLPAMLHAVFVPAASFLQCSDNVLLATFMLAMQPAAFVSAASFLHCYGNVLLASNQLFASIAGGAENSLQDHPGQSSRNAGQGKSCMNCIFMYLQCYTWNTFNLFLCFLQPFRVWGCLLKLR